MKRLFSTTNILIFQAIISFVGLYFVYINNDVAWHLQVADSILSGQRLYHDIIEVNLPLIYYLQIIAVLVADITGIHQTTTSKILVYSIACMSIFLLRLGLNMQTPLHRIILYAFTFSVLILPLGMRVVQFGQKEHLFIIAVMPYTIMRILGKENIASSRIYDIATFVAAIGFCIKPFYILWLVLLELLKIRTHFSQIFHIIFRKENIIMGSVFVTYILLMVMLTPHYFSDVIPFFSRFYYYYRMPADVYLILKACSHMSLYIIPLYMLFAFTPKTLKPFYLVLCSALIVALMQLKGWQYHFFPAMSCAILICSIASYQCYISWRNSDHKHYIVYLVLLLGFVIGFLITPLSRSNFFVFSKGTLYLMLAGCILGYILYLDLKKGKKAETVHTKPKKTKNPAKYMIDSITLSSEFNEKASQKVANQADSEDRNKQGKDLDEIKDIAEQDVSISHKDKAPKLEQLQDHASIISSLPIPSKAQLFSVTFFIGAMLYLTINGLYKSYTNSNANNIYHIDTMVPYLTEHSNDEPVVILSDKLVRSFPVINYAEQNWGLSFSSLWLVTGIENYKIKYAEPFRNQELLQKAESFLINRIASDIMEKKPSLIIEDKHKELLLHWRRLKIPYVTYFAKNEQFKTFFKENYEFKEFLYAKGDTKHPRFAVYAKKVMQE